MKNHNPNLDNTVSNTPLPTTIHRIMVIDTSESEEERLKSFDPVREYFNAENPEGWELIVASTAEEAMDLIALIPDMIDVLVCNDRGLVKEIASMEKAVFIISPTGRHNTIALSDGANMTCDKDDIKEEIHRIMVFHNIYFRNLAQRNAHLGGNA